MYTTRAERTLIAYIARAQRVGRDIFYIPCKLLQQARERERALSPFAAAKLMRARVGLHANGVAVARLEK